MKTLLCLAHFGEAAKIIEMTQMSRLKNRLGFEYYSNQECDLVITGEGIESVILNLSSFLSATDQNYRECLNLGLCGALKNDLELGNTYEVYASIYASSVDEISPKSFTCSVEPTKKSKTCLSFESRVNSKALKATLSRHADLVDRELWGLHYTCKKFALKLRSFKVVSDFADSSAICSEVKEQYEALSDKIYQSFKDIGFGKAVMSRDPLFSQEGLHFSSTQKSKLTKLLKVIKSKGLVFNDKISFKSNRPKEKAAELIRAAELLCFPAKVNIQNKLDSLCMELSTGQVQFGYDKKLEKSGAKINLQINSTSDMRQAIDYLEKVDVSEFLKSFEINN